MKSFLRTVLTILIVCNLVAWMFPLAELLENQRVVAVQGEVISSVPVGLNLSAPEGGGIVLALIEVRAGYVYQGRDYILESSTDSVADVVTPLSEVQKFYSKGRRIVVWVDPRRPDDAKLSRKTPTPILQCAFLFALLVTFFLYVRLKVD